MSSFERINLLEQVEVPFIAALEGLVSFLPAKHLYCTLLWVSNCSEMDVVRLTSRKHEFLVARREFQ